MPAEFFTCVDGTNTLITDCLNNCRLSATLPAGRCLSLRTLRAIADQRAWNGTPSTTQLLKGTREAVLEILTDYAIAPDGSLFRVHGSKAHAFLEQYTGGNEYGEERLTDDFSSGMFDYYDSGTLYDTKTSGSYKVMKVLGLRSVDVETGEAYKSGAKKGQPKTRKEIVDGGVPDRLDWAIQLNDYRMKLQQILPAGERVQQMCIEALVRDGGTYIARERGIERNGYLIPINFISDHWVSRYMRTKAERLQDALTTGIIPQWCNHRETWGGRKCEKYCNVRVACELIPAAGGFTLKEVG